MSAPAAKPERYETFAKRYGVALDPSTRIFLTGRREAKPDRQSAARESGVERVSFLPVLIDKALHPEVLKATDPRFEDAVRYMTWASEGYAEPFRVEGDEVCIA